MLLFHPAAVYKKPNGSHHISFQAKKVGISGSICRRFFPRAYIFLPDQNNTTHKENGPDNFYLFHIRKESFLLSMRLLRLDLPCCFQSLVLA